MKILKINRSNQKRGTPRILIITDVFLRKNDVEAPKQKRGTPRMLIFTGVLKDFDDNNGRREMTYFLILSMAGTTATF